MDATYRESTEALKAEVTRLEGEVDRLSKKRPTRWEVDRDPRGSEYGWSEWAAGWAVVPVLVAVGFGVGWVIVGNDPRVIRGAWFSLALAAVWLAIFVRRVPA